LRWRCKMLRRRFALALVFCPLLVLSLTSALLAVDADGNGFDDDLEVILARRFCPCFRFHEGDALRPMPVGMMAQTHSFTSVPANQLWHRLYLLGHYEGDFRADDPGWNQSFTDFYANPDWNYSSIVGEVLLVCVNPPGDLTWNNYFSIVHVDYGGPSTDLPSEWFPYYNSDNGGPYAHPGRYYKTTVYAHLFWDIDGSGEDVPAIQYWFFYPFNDWVNNHEGDWEHMNLWLTSTDPEQSEIVMAEHYFHEWSIAGLPGPHFYVVDYTHPVVFVGGHGDFHCGSSEGSGDRSNGSYPIYGTWLDAGANVPTCGRPEDTLSEEGDFIWWSNVHVVILPDPAGIDFSVQPDLSWMKANIAWGTLNSQSPGDWLDQYRECGNDAPPGPYWNDGNWAGTATQPNYLLETGNPPPYEPVTESGWVPPEAPTGLEVTVVSPNGTEEWTPGEQKVIVWKTDDDSGVESVDIYLSRDGGASYPITIANGIDDVWSLSWEVTGPTSNICSIKVVARDIDGNIDEDASDYTFKIKYPPGGDPGHGGACPFASAWSGKTFKGFNSILGRSSAQVSGQDVLDYLIFDEVALRGGCWEIEITEFGGDSVYIDRVTLYEIIDGGRSDGLVWADGHVRAYSKIADLCVLGDADDPGGARATSTNREWILDGSVGSEVDYQSRGDVVTSPADCSTDDSYLVIFGEQKDTYPIPPGGLEANRGEVSPDQSVGIYVAAESIDDHSSMFLGRVVPRVNCSPLVVGPISSELLLDADAVVSLGFSTHHRVRGISVAQLCPDPLSTRQCQLASAIAADGADVTNNLTSDDSHYAELADGGRMRVLFHPTEKKTRRNTKLLLEVQGYYFSGPSSTGESGAQSGDGKVGLKGTDTFPNPFSEKITITYSLYTPCHIDISVFDVTGRRIIRLFNGVKGAGVYRTDWDGRDSGGERVSSGMYFVKISSGAQIRFQKILLVN
jgi:hypothetical protein